MSKQSLVLKSFVYFCIRFKFGDICRFDLGNLYIDILYTGGAVGAPWPISSFRKEIKIYFFSLSGMKFTN